MNRRGNFPYKLEKMLEVGEGKFTIWEEVIGVYTCTGIKYIDKKVGHNQYRDS